MCNTVYWAADLAGRSQAPSSQHKVKGCCTGAEVGPGAGVQSIADLEDHGESAELVHHKVASGVPEIA